MAITTISRLPEITTLNLSTDILEISHAEDDNSAELGYFGNCQMALSDLVESMNAELSDGIAFDNPIELSADSLEIGSIHFTTLMASDLSSLSDDFLYSNTLPLVPIDGKEIKLKATSRCRKVVINDDYITISRPELEISSFIQGITPNKFFSVSDSKKIVTFTTKPDESTGNAGILDEYIYNVNFDKNMTQISAEAPVLSGEFINEDLSDKDSGEITGCFEVRKEPIHVTTLLKNAENQNCVKFTFDASKYNAVYGKNGTETIESDSISYVPYVVITSSKVRRDVV